MSKKLPKFDLGEPDAAQEFIKGAGTLPPSRAIGDEQLATQLNATQHNRYPWQGADPRVEHKYTIGFPDRLNLKLEKLRELGRVSKRSVFLAGAETEADRLLIAHGIPPDEL